MMIFGKSVTFASNVFNICLLGKVMVLRKVPLAITIPKKLVLLSEKLSLSSYKPFCYSAKCLFIT